MNQRPASFVWIYSLVLVLSVAIAAVGTRVAITSHSWALLAVGCACVVGVMISWPIAFQLSNFHRVNCEQAERAWTNINDRFEQFSVMLNLISEQQLISDRAKSVAFRDKDAEVLRRAIQDEIIEQHWEAAESLIDEMERQFGFRHESETLRRQIGEKHGERVRKQMNDAMTLIDRYTRAEAWADAHQEATRIAATLPDHAPAVELPREVERRHEAHRRQLISSWNDAVARNDVDSAIEILKRLDSYLSPTEAEPLQETARHVFKEKLHQLRSQFSAAVQQHQWNEAVTIGETIQRDFPNTKMAREISEPLSWLRDQAAGLQTAKA